MLRTKKTTSRSVTYPRIPMLCDPDRRHPRSSSMNQVNEATKLNTQLIESIPGGDIANMKRLMTIGANPNAMCRLNHVSACHIAAMHDNDALDLLLRSGADGSRSDKQGRTPLYLAAWEGNAKQIALLLKSLEVAVVRRVSFDRESYCQRESRRVEDCIRIPLDVEHVAVHRVSENNLKIIPSHANEKSTLSDSWCDGLAHNCRNVMDQLPPFQQGWTALHAASARAQYHCVQLLLATTGADTSAQDQLCRTPLDVAGYAHYMGHKIDVNNLMETVDLLLKAGGKFLKYSFERGSLDTPLHSAVELESEAAVEQMLRGGASVKFWNSQGLTAMHVCVKKRNKELLKLLVNHKCSNEDPCLATADMKNAFGLTVICAAVCAQWIEGVSIALSAGASITFKENGQGPFDMAISLSNIDILEKILNIAKNRNIDYCNVVRETAIFTAIQGNYLDVVKFLLKHGSSIEVEDRTDGSNVFHKATICGRKEILELLLKYDSSITKRLINKSDKWGPPLHHAIGENYPDCAELLISEGAQVNAEYFTWLEIYPTTLLHTAAQLNHCEIAEMIIKKDNTTIRASVKEMWTPLHAACEYGKKEMIELLLRKGADLSGGENVNGYSAKQKKCPPIKLLMSSVSKPTEYLEEIFDSYITREGQESSYMIKVDHRVLLPKSGTKPMRVIKALINTGNRYDQRRLLRHPLVQSFLHPRWRSLLPFFYCIIALHVCFVLSLNVFALSLFWYKDRKIEPVPSIFRCSVWIYIIYFTACLLTIQEIIVIKMKSKRYLLCLESLVKWLSTTLAVILPQVVSWDSKPNPEWVRLFGSAALLFTWVRMMFLLSRLPDYGYYVLMYGKVATKVFKILVSFGFLIFGFSLCFMIQFHAQPPFEDPWSSFLVTMVMMTSEFGYNETINEKSVNHASASLIMKRFIFVSFLILVSIILMNLLVGVAVNDVNNLEIIGNINRLEKQVQFITSFEDIGNKFLKKILPTNKYERLFKIKGWNNSHFFLYYGYPDEYSYCHRLPARLREAIFEKANFKEQSDGERETMLYYNKKLDQMHKLIVKKYGGELPKSKGSDNALMMKLDGIHKIIERHLERYSERLSTLDTAMHKMSEEILKLRNKFETN